MSFCSLAVKHQSIKSCSVSVSTDSLVAFESGRGRICILTSVFTDVDAWSIETNVILLTVNVSVISSHLVNVDDEQITAS